MISHFVEQTKNQLQIKMKFFVVALALVACVMADVSELGYDYHAPAPVEHHEVSAPVTAPKNTYIPPAVHAPAPAPVYHAPAPVHHAPAPVHHAPAPVYHPAPAPAPVAPQNTYIPPAAPAPAPVVHHAPAPAPVQHYEPAPAPVHIEAPAPVAPQNTYIPPAAAPAPVHIDAPAPVEPSAELAEDGYRYKTVRRVVYRHRF